MLVHRFQLLLDDDRYRRVTQLAQEHKVSTATVICEAIDRSLPETPSRRAASGTAILDAPEMPVPADPASLRAELDAERARRG
jgi:hypothetical protein